MRRLATLLVLLISACNLNNTPATPTTSAPTPELPAPAATAAPSLTPLLGAGATAAATRTPFGSDAAPTTLPLAATDAFALPITGERADISSPANGAAVRGGSLCVSGTVHNLPEDQFTLQVFDAGGQPISIEQTVPLSNPNHIADVPWSASVMVSSGYTGAAQIRISARTTAGSDAVIGMVSVTVDPAAAASCGIPASGSSNYGSITTPVSGASIGANSITVTGTAGGLADNQFTLLLLDGSGTILNSQLITLTGAETNAVPWTALLGTGGYHGSVEIRAAAVSGGQQITIASVTVTLQ